jgi:hypothetical protein
VGRPDPDVDHPRVVALAAGSPRYGLGWGCDLSDSVHWHSATDSGLPAERLTAAQWQALTAAAVTGEAELNAALALSPAGRAWSKAKTRADAAVQGGAAALLTATRDRYAAWHGLPLGAAWITG